MFLKFVLEVFTTLVVQCRDFFYKSNIKISKIVETLEFLPVA